MRRHPQGGGQVQKTPEFLLAHKLHLFFLAVAILALFSGVLRGLVAQWASDDNYSHGFLIPFLSGYFLYERKQALAEMEARGSWTGLVVVVLSLLLFLAGSLTIELFSTRLSLVLLLCGATLFLFGGSVFRAASLPLLYLLFMVPLPYILYDAVSFPLKLFMTRVSVVVMQLIGISVLREGNILLFPNLTLEVADACSGLRSLMTLFALSVAFAFLFHGKNWQRLVLVFLAIPVAVVTNIFRVVATGALSQKFGESVATGFFHEFAGLTVFALALTLLGFSSWLMKRVDR